MRMMPTMAWVRYLCLGRNSRRYIPPNGHVEMRYSCIVKVGTSRHAPERFRAWLPLPLPGVRQEPRLGHSRPHHSLHHPLRQPQTRLNIFIFLCFSLSSSPFFRSLYPDWSVCLFPAPAASVFTLCLCKEQRNGFLRLAETGLLCHYSFPSSRQMSTTTSPEST